MVKKTYLLRLLGTSQDHLILDLCQSIPVHNSKPSTYLIERLPDIQVCEILQNLISYYSFLTRYMDSNLHASRDGEGIDHVTPCRYNQINLITQNIHVIFLTKEVYASCHLS
jgi:hypothetical protein